MADKIGVNVLSLALLNKMVRDLNKLLVSVESDHFGKGTVHEKKSICTHVHCGKCGLAFHSGEIQKRMKVFHESLTCPCGVILEKTQKVQQQSSECILGLVTCRFCGGTLQARYLAADTRDWLRGLSEHESLCGSRTAPHVLLWPVCHASDQLPLTGSLIDFNFYESKSSMLRSQLKSIVGTPGYIAPEVLLKNKNLFQGMFGHKSLLGPV
ncbi:TRAF-like protein [Artemisia annua]|uniref:TRAF-like protein n=1 Tax=Artemisia annua TaxID=35608 RepID=A0A2U1MBL3_ARTAN|nr:TRAF-like protein [Artemisia annua]